MNGHGIGAILLTISLYVLIRTGVFSAAPLRNAPQRTNILSFAAIAVVFLVYVLAGGTFAILARYLPPTQQSSAIEIVSGLSAIAAACAFGTRWFEKGLSGLGIAARNIPRGVGLGILSFGIITPILYLVLVMTETVARDMTHKLPPVHPALKAMATDHSHVSVGLLVVLVVVIAPISEELFFRGLIQSWLCQKLAGVSVKSPAAPDSHAYAISAPREGDDPASLADLAVRKAVFTDGGDSSPWPLGQWLPRNRWIAILITATVFAGVHYAVTPGYIEWFPSLFLLGVALGYIYELTGNIWTDITMHACFNLVPTLLILSGVKPK